MLSRARPEETRVYEYEDGGAVFYLLFVSILVYRVTCKSGDSLVWELLVLVRLTITVPCRK